MNKATRESLLNQIETIQDFNVDDAIIKKFGGSENIEKETIGEFTTVEFKAFFKKAIDQLKAELESDEYFLLPDQINNVYGSSNINLGQIIGKIKNFLHKNDLNSIPNFLGNLILYQKTLGFWNKGPQTKAENRAFEVKKSKESIDLLGKQIQDQLSDLKKIKIESEKERKEINRRKGELTKIENLLDQVKGKANAIDNLLLESQSSRAKIEEQENTQESLIKDFRKRLEEERQKFENFEKANIESTKKVEELLSKSEGYYQSFERNLKFIGEKKEDILRLTGYAADGALGNKFFERQNSLKNSIKIWGFVVIVVTILTGIWVFLVFTQFAETSQTEWINLVANILKTLPAFLLLGFTINQYVKERNIQEEYAYRAAVAMTITAYSEMLQDADKEENKSRQKMLLDAITQVYSSPRIYREKEGKIYSFSTKDLREAVKDLTLTVRELKNDLLK